MKSLSVKKDFFARESEIWLVDLEPTKGIEIKKVRPCLILKKFSHTHFVVLPITSKYRSDKIAFKLETSILKEEANYLNISQIRAIDKIRLIRKLGEISTKKFFAIKLKTVEVLKLPPQKADAYNSKKL